MPSTPQRGFIVRPTQDNTEPECESVNVQACTDPYSFISDGVATISRCGIASSWNISVSSDTVPSSSVEERIKD